MLLKYPLLFYIRKFWQTFLLGMIFLIITNFLDGYSPLLIKKVIDQVTSHESLSNIIKTAVTFFVLMSVLAGTRFCWRTFFGNYHTRAAEHLRRHLYNHLIHLDSQFFSKNQIGELMSLLVNDVQSFRQAIGSAVLILVDGVVIILVILPIMISLSPAWTWKTMIFLPLIPFLIKWVTQAIFRRYKIEQDLLSSLSGFTQESISGIRILKSFVRESQRLSQYASKSRDYEIACNQVASVDSLFSPIMEFGVASGSVILIFIATDDLLLGVATVGSFVAFQRYITKMVWPMTAFGLGFSQYQKGMASFSRIVNVLKVQTRVPDLGTKTLSDFQNLEVRNLSFRFDDQAVPALTDISFRLRRGQKLGIVGNIGSGKSTLVQLLCRVLPTAQPEQVLINGVGLENYTLNSVRESLTLALQEPLLFSMSIEENLRIQNPDVTMEQIQNVLSLVQIWDEIQKFPEGLKTELGEKGVNLSGGQKQRLALARTLLSNSSLIILDDVMSAVDVHTEETLIRGLATLEKTLILISHRLSVLASCDTLLVLSGGQVEMIGTPEELLKGSPTYRQIFEHQKAQGTEAVQPGPQEQPLSLPKLRSSLQKDEVE